MNQFPFIGLSMSLALGIVWGTVCPISSLSAAILFILMLIGLLWCLKKRQGVVLVSLACGVGLGLFSSRLHSESIQPVFSCGNEANRWRAKIRYLPERSRNVISGKIQQKVELDLLQEKCGTNWQARKGYVKTWLDAEPKLTRGDIVEVTLHVRPFPSPRNPDERLPASIMWTSGLNGRVQVLSNHAHIKSSSRFWRFIGHERQKAAEWIELRFPQNVATIVKALALGDRGALSPQQRETWAQSGIIHLLAISGLHIAFLGMVIYRLSILLIHTIPGSGDRFSIRRLSCWLTIPLIFAFCVWVGAPVSASRATIIVVAYLVGRAWSRSHSGANALGLAAFLMLLFDPTTLFDVGFMLSFSAVAILLSLAYYYPSLSHMPLGKKILFGTAITSFLISLGTAPITASYFGYVSIVAPLTNIVAIPIGAMLVMPLALLVTFCRDCLPGMDQIIIPTLHGTVTSLNMLARYMQQWELATIDLTKPSAAEIVAYYALCITGFLLCRRSASLWRHWWRRIMIASLGLLGVSIGWRWVQQLPDGKLHIHFPYVGQGETAIIRSPDNQIWLIDAGGAKHSTQKDPGREVIAPLLRKHLVRSIDLAVVTHPHPDHINGFHYLAKKFHIKELWYNGYDQNLHQSLIDIVQKKKGTVKAIQDLPSIIQRGDVHIEIVHPMAALKVHEPELWTGQQYMNDRSIVLRLVHKSRSILLASDIEQQAEMQIASQLSYTDILKSPHHGSSSSSTRTFLKAIKTPWVMISCGEDNHYGFPHAETLKRYHEQKMLIWRTDLDGMISFVSDGHHWYGSSTRGKSATYPSLDANPSQEDEDV